MGLNEDTDEDAPFRIPLKTVKHFSVNNSVFAGCILDFTQSLDNKKLLKD